MATIAALMLYGCDRTTKPQTLEFCSVTPDSLTFDADHPTRQFILSNTGSSRITGAVTQYGEFVAETGVYYDLLPGQSDTVTVRFRPHQAGHRSVSLYTGCTATVHCEGEAEIVHTLYAVHCDTYVSQVAADSVFDLAPLLKVGWSGAAPPTGFETAFLRFDLYRLSDHYVSSAKLRLYHRGCAPGSAPLQVACGATQDTVNCPFANGHTLTGGYSIKASVREIGCGVGFEELDATDLLNGFLTGHYPIAGLLVVPVNAPGSGAHHWFDSAEGEFAPELVVDQVAPGRGRSNGFPTPAEIGRPAKTSSPLIKRRPASMTRRPPSRPAISQRESRDEE